MLTVILVSKLSEFEFFFTEDSGSPDGPPMSARSSIKALRVRKATLVRTTPAMLHFLAEGSGSAKWAPQVCMKHQSSARTDLPLGRDALLEKGVVSVLQRLRHDDLSLDCQCQGRQRGVNDV